jgi:hypothetical protein
MPTYNPNVRPAGVNTPGNWLCKIERQLEIKHEARPGVIIGSSAKGDEMWKMVIRCIDTHPEAPCGSIIFENQTWSLPGTPRGYAMLAAMGHDLSKLPANAPITPEMVYERPFVLMITTTEDGFLATADWNPFLPADTANRGPVIGRKVKPGRDSAGGAGGAGGAKAPSASNYGYGDLPPASAGAGAGAAGASATGASAGGAAPLPWETF